MVEFHRSLRDRFDCHREHMDCGGYGVRVEAVIDVDQELDFIKFFGM
jgi:hypothetical protein